MKSLIQRTALAALLAVMGCSTAGRSYAPASDNVKPAAGTQANHAVTLRFNQYVDQRQVSNPRFLGQVSTRVFGVSGNELILDQDIAGIATTAIRNRFRAEGFRVLEGDDANNALFEVSGVIRELVLNVGNRDEINISIETTLKDAATGKVVWSGMVTEKNDRFAGVSGNNKADVVAYLDKGLKVVSGKTVEAIGSSLAASRPELFNLTPGTKAIKGVEVYVAPPASAPVSAAEPPVPVAAAVQTRTLPANASTGLLSVNTSPSRARVYVDGVYFGLSPLHSEIEPGVHEVVVKLEGHKTAAEKVSVRKGDNTELELKLEH